MNPINYSYRYAIDNYENEVYELDTDDPFYGLYVEMENLENE